MIQPQNAIEQRLDILHDQWNEFAVISEARVLRWLVTDDEWRTVEAFLAVESDDQGGDTPDVHQAERSLDGARRRRSAVLCDTKLGYERRDPPEVASHGGQRCSRSCKRAASSTA